MALPAPLDRDEYAARFRASQQLIVSASENRQRCLQQLLSCIEDCQQAVDTARQKNPEIQLQEPQELVDARDRLASQLTLSIIVFGRSNTGKSTLLNQILRQWPDQSVSQTKPLFPTAGHNCSARIATVCYGPTKEARVIDRSGPSPTVLEQLPFHETGQIRGFMELTGTSRQDEVELRKLVEIQLPHPLLQGRLRLVDSPGMGEDQTMNQVVREFLEEIKSGIIVYVIDGKEGYKPNPDSENIKFLREQHDSLQRLLVANRVDFDFEYWYGDQSDDLEWLLDDDPLEEVLEGLKKLMDFDYTQKCQEHTKERLASVRNQVDQVHPDCLTGGTVLIGVSAKSVKEFFAGEQKLAHAPYVDSFLQLESHLAALVRENGRRHLLAASRTAKNHLVQAKTLSTRFFGERTERSDQMMELLERSIETIRKIFNHISQSLDTVLQCDALDLSSEGSELNRLRRLYASEDVSPDQQAIDAPLMMREAEAQLVQSLLKIYGGTRETKAAIRLLCDFKDAVVSRLRTILIWNYKMIFMVEANRPLSRLDAQCQSLLDSLKQQTSQVENGQACVDVIDLAKANIFTPNVDSFSVVCTTQLADSMRQALAALTKRDEFRRIADSLTPQFSRSVEQRDRVLTYFMNTVDLSKQMANVINCYRIQLKEQKVFVDNLLSALLQNLREQGIHTRCEMKTMQVHNDKMAAMTFYIDALVTEVNWTADYDTSLQVFRDECSAMEGDQSDRLLQVQLRPRCAGHGDGSESGSSSVQKLHYRLVRLQQDDARRLASDVAEVSGRLGHLVRLSWLCLSDTYRGFMESASVQLLLGIVGHFASLAELPPAGLPDAARLAWLASLIDCCAKLAGAARRYRPGDYQPSCVLLRRLPPDECGGSGDCGYGGLSGDAFPEPTRLLVDPAQAPDAVSLAACAVVLFTQGGPGADAGRPDANANADDIHGWDASHARELRRLTVGDHTHYLNGLDRRLASPERPRDLVRAVAGCVRACLETAVGSGGRDGAVRNAAEQLQGARKALLSVTLTQPPAAVSAAGSHKPDPSAS